MNIFLDTTQSEFVACLFDENFIVKKKFIKTTVYKVEEIPKFFNELMISEKINIEDIKNFYINIGPGSFTGSRISLVYVRTIAQITGSNIWTTNSFKLLKDLSPELYLVANKNHSFKIQSKNIDKLSTTTLVKKSNNEKLINYNDLLKNFKSYLIFFNKEDLLKIKVEYGSTPQIGLIK